MENMEIYNKYSSVPKEAQKPIQAGRLKGMTDINPMWRFKCLTEQFGPCGIGWYYNVKEKWIESVGNEVVAFVDIELFVKIDGEWSKPILGSGGSKLATQEKSGIFVSDECYKMATTDAISVACKQLGIGADVYWQSGRSKYSNTAPQEQAVPEDKPRDPNLINAEQMGKIKLEMVRTGVAEPTICKMCGIQQLNDMTIEQFEKVMKKFANTADRKA